MPQTVQKWTVNVARGRTCGIMSGMKKLNALFSAVLCAALVSFAVRAEELPQWTFYTADAEGNPCLGMGCITDGTWIIRADYRNETARTLVLVPKGMGENAHLNGLDHGDTLDLRGVVTSPDGLTTNRISHINLFAFGGDSTKGTVKNFIAPTTLECGLFGWFTGATNDVNGNVISECSANYTNIVIHVPGWFEQLGPRQLPITSGPVNWDLELPQLQHIQGWSLHATTKSNPGNTTATFGPKTFPGLKSISNNGMSNSGFSGALHLPSLNSIGAWGAGGNTPGFTEVVLAPEKKCVNYLGQGCLGWLHSLTNLVLGLAAENTICSQAFQDNELMTRVEFTGYPPKFASGASNCFTGPGEKGITFIVPLTKEWKDFLAPFEANGAFVRWTDAEVLDYHNANPDKPAIIGTVGSSVFKSNKTHYLAVASRALSEVLQYDTFFGDMVATDVACDSQGRLPWGMDVTLTARPNAANGGVFAGWYGDVPGGKCTNMSVKIRFDQKPNGRMPWVFARFTHPWKLVEVNGGQGIISNGNFRIKVKVDTSTRLVSPGLGSAHSLYAADDTGRGVLDLGGPITDMAGNPYHIRNFGSGNKAFASAAGTTHGASVFVSAGSCTSFSATQIFHATGNRATYDTIILDEPTATGDSLFEGWMFSDQVNLRRLVLRFGTMTSAVRGGDGAFYNNLTADTDLGWWDLPALSVIGNGALFKGASAYCDGILSLPALKTMGSNFFLNNNKFSEIWLGHGSKKTQVASLGATAFKGCSGVTNLVINAASTLTVAENTFTGASGLKTITYLGPAVDETAFANVLAGIAVVDTPEKPAIVYVSSNQPSWRDVTYLSSLTDEEKAVAPQGELVLGVYRAGAAAPAGKVWVCHRKSAFDPSYTTLILR